jgi:hypothetical protein
MDSFGPELLEIDLSSPERSGRSTSQISILELDLSRQLSRLSIGRITNIPSSLDQSAAITPTY